jgi:hypothetical protein
MESRKPSDTKGFPVPLVHPTRSERLPCQGGGRGFESRRPLHVKARQSAGFRRSTSGFALPDWPVPWLAEPVSVGTTEPRGETVTWLL